MTPTIQIAPVELPPAAPGSARREGSAAPPGGNLTPAARCLLAKLEAEQAQGDPSWEVDGMVRRVLDLITAVWNDTAATNKRAAA